MGHQPLGMGRHRQVQGEPGRPHAVLHQVPPAQDPGGLDDHAAHRSGHQVRVRHQAAGVPAGKKNWKKM